MRVSLVHFIHPLPVSVEEFFVYCIHNTNDLNGTNDLMVLMRPALASLSDTLMHHRMIKKNIKVV
jgi:hypothetical protein